MKLIRESLRFVSSFERYDTVVVIALITLAFLQAFGLLGASVLTVLSFNQVSRHYMYDNVSCYYVFLLSELRLERISV